TATLALCQSHAQGSASFSYADDWRGDLLWRITSPSAVRRGACVLPMLAGSSGVRPADVVARHLDDTGQHNRAAVRLPVEELAQALADRVVGGLALLLHQPLDLQAGLVEQRLGVAHMNEPPADDLRASGQLAVLVDGQDGHDEAIRCQSFAVTQHRFVHIVEQAPVDAHVLAGHRLAVAGLHAVELPDLVILEDEAPLLRNADLACQPAVQVQMARLAVYRDEEVGFDRFQHLAHVFLRAVPGGVDGGHAAVDDERTAREQLVDDARHAFLFAGNDAARHQH